MDFRDSPEDAAFRQVVKEFLAEELPKGFGPPSGPNAALPHAHPGDRRLQQGDLVVLDFGGVYGGYCVDLTRTVAVGTPDPEMRSRCSLPLALPLAK